MSVNPIYSDLSNLFPAAIDNMDKFRDPDPASVPIINQYYTYFNAGNLASADALLEANPQLKLMLLGAENMNGLRDGIISVQRFFFDEVQQYLVNIVKPKGEWDASAKYTKYDVVQYIQNGAVESFMGIKTDIPIGTSPVNSHYFVAITLRGEQGVSGLGLSPRGYWSSASQYYVNDCVSYNDVLWYAKRDNVGQVPKDVSDDWDKLLLIPKQIISSVSMPGSQTAGDLWFAEGSGDAFEIKKKKNDGAYTPLYPKTKAECITLANGTTVEATTTATENRLSGAETRIGTAEAQIATAQGTANTALAKANADMPITGGQFTGAVYAPATADLAVTMRNVVVMPVGSADFSGIPVGSVILVKK